MLFRCLFVLVGLLVVVSYGWMGSEDDKVLLRDVSAITLYPNRMTTGRRSSPVSQMKCVGGTAGCSKFTPSVVQCKNVGSDGFDVQWECKADMDDSYRFGKIQVSCEGYNHPNDPYVLKGSCGLEYTVDYTEAGHKRQHKNEGSYGSSYYQQNTYKSNSGGGSWFVFIIIIVAIVFLIRKMTADNNADTPHQRMPNNGPSPSQRPGPSAPPSYGFKSEYTRETGPPSYSEATTASDHATHSSYSGTPTYTRTQNQNPNTNTGQFGGFWSGMGLGSLAGYMFGSRNNQGYSGNNYGGYGYNGGYNNGWGSRRGWGRSNWGGSWGGGGSSWGGGGGSWSSSSGSSSRSSSSSPGSSRTASGFGGTSRR